MAIIDCPECGHQVSDAAETCPSCGVRLTGQTAELQLQLELGQIDLEWERERQGLMCHKMNGEPYVPTKARARFEAVALLVVGVGSIFLLSILPVIGIGPGKDVDNLKLLFAGFLFIVGLGWSFRNYSKAESYEAAEAEYLRKKEAARSKYEAQAEKPDVVAPEEPHAT